MKKILCIMVLLAVFGNFSIVSAEHRELLQDEKKVATLMLLKQNWIQPEHGDGFFCEGITLYWHHKANIGLGMDTDLAPKSNYVRYRAYLTYNSGPWYLLAGASTDSVGKDYVQAGVWYFNKHGLAEVFIDQRLYAAVDGNSKTYSDLFVEITYPITDGIVAGINASYDHIFESSQHDWWMAGPVVYTTDLLGKGLTPYFRIAYDSDIKNSQKNINAWSYRVALKITF